MHSTSSLAAGVGFFSTFLMSSLIGGKLRSGSSEPQQRGQTGRGSLTGSDLAGSEELCVVGKGLSPVRVRALRSTRLRAISARSLVPRLDRGKDTELHQKEKEKKTASAQLQKSASMWRVTRFGVTGDKSALRTRPAPPLETTRWFSNRNYEIVKETREAERSG